GPAPTEPRPTPEPAVAPPPAPPALPPSPPLPEHPSTEQLARRQPPPAPAPPPPAAETPPPAPASRPLAIPHRAIAHVNRTAWEPRAWSAAVTTGNAARVLAEADAHGLDKALVEVDSPALVALADASRYTGRPEIAVRALTAERQRFPNTPSAHAAAF